MEFHRAEEDEANNDHSPVEYRSSEDSTYTSDSSKFGSENARKISDAINNNADVATVVKERIARR